MQEFESISASSYDPSALATKLTAKAADGWSVVAIVPTGGDVTAFLSRDKSGADGARSESSAAQDENRDDEIAPFVLAANNSSAGTETLTEERHDAASESVNEPAGWAIAPEAAAGATAAATTPTLAASGSSAISGQSATESAPAAAAAPVAAAAPAPAPDPAPAPAVPAGWYADPAGRFELRYWDGTTWTEHVSRAGQQFTDPPVA
jgi:hypothetical protein